LALETLNEQMYRPIALKYDLEVQGLIVALKTRAAEFAVSMFPEKALSGLADATVNYVAELKILRDLSPQEDRAFFDYAIIQEQAQAQALKHATAGRFDLGANVLRDFVAKHP